MNLLITGATGFLGQHVVTAALAAGHRVRAIVRPSSKALPAEWSDRVDIVRADLAGTDDLSGAFTDIEVVIHLAATLSGDAVAQGANTVGATKRLLGAMPSSVRRLVHASSFSVYDWRQVKGTLDEQTAVENEDVRDRDDYAVAKVQQEQDVRIAASQGGFELVVLRPGAIWGRGRLGLLDLGPSAGPLLFVIAPSRLHRGTYVENCAEAFIKAAEVPEAAGQTINIIDGHAVTASQYAAMCSARGAKMLRLPIPYFAARAVTLVFGGIQRVVSPRKRILPSILVPRRFEARFKPVRYDGSKAQTLLKWSPRYTLAEGLDRSFHKPEGGGT
jgi:nucleoside-diphosphate-sugar epimerase